MSLLTADAPIANTIDYCRRARRIRAILKRDPFLRHEALVDLARRRNIQTRLDSWETVERDFSNQATAELQPFGFTFSDRLKLLDTAERKGISRFRANLILATCEHQAPRTWAPATVKPKIPSLLVVLAMEAALVAAVMWICAI